MDTPLAKWTSILNVKIFQYHFILGGGGGGGGAILSTKESMDTPTNVVLAYPPEVLKFIKTKILCF